MDGCWKTGYGGTMQVIFDFFKNINYKEMAISFFLFVGFFASVVFFTIFPQIWKYISTTAVLAAGWWSVHYLIFKIKWKD